MPNVRPAKPKWTDLPGGAPAPTALGEMTIHKSEKGFWHAQLNGFPFPVLYESLPLAKQSATIVASNQGHQGNTPMVWAPNSVSGESATGVSGDFHIVASEGISGFFVMHGDLPALIPLSSMEEAQEACAQYLSYVWFSLSEIA